MASLFGGQLAASDVTSDVTRVITRETPRPDALSMREVPAPTGDRHCLQRRVGGCAIPQRPC